MGGCMHTELSWRHCSGSPPAMREKIHSFRAKKRPEQPNSYCVPSDVSVLLCGVLAAAPWSPRCVVTHNDCIVVR